MAWNIFCRKQFHSMCGQDGPNAVIKNRSNFTACATSYILIPTALPKLWFSTFYTLDFQWLISTQLKQSGQQLNCRAPSKLFLTNLLFFDEILQLQKRFVILCIYWDSKAFQQSSIIENGVRTAHCTIRHRQRQLRISWLSEDDQKRISTF